MTRPDAFAVLAATAHPDTRVIRLADRTVLRTPGQPASRVGNAVHHVGVPAGDVASATAAALTDARRRLPDPSVTPTVVLRRPSADDGVDATATPPGTALDVLVLPGAADAVAAWPGRADVGVRPPGDDRGWHAVTVLRRHATPGGGADAADVAGSPTEDPEVAARARGGRDHLLRWWVDGRRRLVADGRARVALAERFGTPVATATLVWDPAAEVGPGAAGLAVITDLVVHPAHRGLGIAAIPVAWLLDTHLAAFPRAAVAAIAPARLTPALRRRGWVRHDRLVEITDEGER